MSKIQMFSMKPQQVSLENGNVVYVRRLSAAERLEWFEYISEIESKSEKPNSLALSLENSLKLIALGLSDEEGNRKFTDKEMGLLSEIDCQTVDFLVTEIMSVNGMGGKREDVEKK